MNITGGKGRMIILWIRKGGKDGSFPSRNNSDAASFRAHDECMKKFRLAHPRLEEAGSGSLRTLADQPLAPLQRIALGRYVHN